jgi:cyclohexyl-isocyanide hydratase
MATLSIGFLLFPDVEPLDLTGPLQVLHRVPDASVAIVAKTRDPVASNCGLGLAATVDFATCGALDLLCVPGGPGILGAIADRETMDFVRRQAAQARWVTSVCTGAFVLGAAGLLRGRRATTHWAYADLLPLVGATYQKARIVRDGNVVTGGGVTAGIDFGLTIAAEIAGAAVAQAIELGIEYDPAPPFAVGHPDRAPAAVLTPVTARFAPRVAEYRAAIEQAMAA